MNESTSTASKKVPVTVLTGFLGAGKTTLLNRILTENHGKRIAVIENEFGAIGIDNDLVVNADEEIFEMNNGCICCTVRGDLIRILGNLMKRKDRFDYILVETTGLADPAPVVQTFFVDDEIKSQLSLDGLVTLVDCAHVELHADAEEVKEQIAFADVILLNKTDLVPADKVAAVEAKVRGMNRFAKIHRTAQASTELEHLLNIRAFDLDKALEVDPNFLTETAHEHDPDVNSVAFDLVGDLDEKKFERWIGTVLRDKGTDIFRMKGILSMAGQPNQYVFQGVHMLFDGAEGKPWHSAIRGSKLVFIGRKLDQSWFEAGFRACLA